MASCHLLTWPFLIAGGEVQQLHAKQKSPAKECESNGNKRRRQTDDVADEPTAVKDEVKTINSVCADPSKELQRIEADFGEGGVVSPNVTREGLPNKVSPELEWWVFGWHAFGCGVTLANVTLV